MDGQRHKKCLLKTLNGLNKFLNLMNVLWKVKMKKVIKDVQYPKKLLDFHMIYLFCLEKLVANLHGKTEYFLHIRNLKPALNHELALKKLHRIIKFKQKLYWNDI